MIFGKKTVVFERINYLSLVECFFVEAETICAYIHVMYM